MPDLNQRVSMPTVGLSEDDEAVRHLVTAIAKALVDESEAVHVNVSEDDDVVTFHLRVAASDIGKLIGKQGRTARSLRTILGAVAMKLRHRYALNIPDDRTDAYDLARHA